MAKAILVIDMPKNCGECDLFVCYRQYAGDKGDCFCGKTKQDTPSKGRPEWCPLKPMPEKREQHSFPKGYDEGWDNGFNACIDAICGKE